MPEPIDSRRFLPDTPVTYRSEYAMRSKHPTGTAIISRTAGIPDGYRKAVLRALPCNPSQLFVYWELPRSGASCSAITLALFEQTSDGIDPQPVVEQPAFPQTQSCYLPVPGNGRSYSISLTATYTDGPPVTLQSTTAVRLPTPVQQSHSPVPAVIVVPDHGSAVDAVPLPAEEAEHHVAVAIPVSTPNFSSWSLQERAAT